MVSPSHALWRVGISATGGTPLAACQNYVASLGGGWTLDGMRPFFHPTTGKYQGETCLVRYNPTGAITPIDALPECPAGFVLNDIALSGCTVLAKPHDKNEGPQCGTPDSGGVPRLGNPITALVGNKFEEAVDFATMGPDVLELRRYYNSVETKRSPFGRGWRSNFDRSIAFLSGGVRQLSRPDGRMAQFLFSSALGDYVDMDLRLAQVGSDW